MTRQRVKGVLLKHLSYITPFFTYTHKHAHAPPHAHAHTFKHALTHKYKFSAFTNEQFLYSFLQIKNIIHPASTEVHTNLFCTTQTYKVTKKKAHILSLLPLLQWEQCWVTHSHRYHVHAYSVPGVFALIYVSDNRVPAKCDGTTQRGSFWCACAGHCACVCLLSAWRRQS